MTLQEIFDRVAKHLREQGERSHTSAGGCMYRLGSLRCAVGCLIDDQHYSSMLEHQAADNPDVIEAVSLSIGQTLDDESKQLLAALQHAHDEWNDCPESLEEELEYVADEFGLKMNANDELPTAGECSSKVDSAQSLEAVSIRSEIVKAIKTAVDQGRVSADVSNIVPYRHHKAIENWLKRKGYTVNSGDDQRGGQWFIVDW